MTDAKALFYPETAAGGFSRVDGTVDFYTRINALLHPDMVVLDLGAGRGAGLRDDLVPYRRQLRTIRGKCTRVIGVDVDSAVLENPGLDEAHVIDPGGRFPIADTSVDLIISDATFEHVLDPKKFAAEIDRVLRPGGWVCARTPNRWGYIAIAAQLVPNHLHSAVLRLAQPHRKSEDIFPTAYRLNTNRALRKHFPSGRYNDFSYGSFAEPAYFGSSKVLWFFALLGFWLTPRCLAPTRMIFMEKKAVATSRVGL